MLSTIEDKGKLYIILKPYMYARAHTHTHAYIYILCFLIHGCYLYMTSKYWLFLINFSTSNATQTIYA